MLRILTAIFRRLRLLHLRFLGLQTVGRPWIQQVDIPRNHRAIVLGNGVALDRGVTLLVSGENVSDTRIRIGSHTYVNRQTMIDASLQVQVGSHCMIGPFVYITDHDHGVDVHTRIQDQPLVEAAVAIENDVWIGAHATILKGVTIGEGAVIAAGAVVTKNVASNSIVAGVPARVIGERPQGSHT